MTRFMAQISQYGELCVQTERFNEGRRYFFPEGSEPERGQWIVFDTAQSAMVGNILRLNPGAWRNAKLDDLADMSIGIASYFHGFVETFPTWELALFLQSNQRKLRRTAKQVGAAAMDKNHERTLRLVDEDFDRTERMSKATAALPRRLAVDAAVAYEAIESQTFDRLLAQPGLDVRQLLEYVKQAKSGRVFARALKQFGQQLRNSQLPDEQVESLLRECSFPVDNSNLARHVDDWHERSRADNEFWAEVGTYYSFPQNVRGERIDITNAHPAKFMANYRAAHAKRVGNLKPGRSCLVIYNYAGTDTYIAGSKSLQYEIANNGGELKVKGVTLTLGEHEDSELNELLLEIEQLELLATTNPAEAIADLGVAPGGPIAIAAERAKTDYKWGHILADLLIEELFEIDADVIRRMIRGRQKF